MPDPEELRVGGEEGIEVDRSLCLLGIVRWTALVASRARSAPAPAAGGASTRLTHTRRLSANCHRVSRRPRTQSMFSPSTPTGQGVGRRLRRAPPARGPLAIKHRYRVGVGRIKASARIGVPILQQRRRAALSSCAALCRGLAHASAPSPPAEAVAVLLQALDTLDETAEQAAALTFWCASCLASRES